VTALDRRAAFYARHGRRPLESGAGNRLYHDADGALTDRHGRTLEQVRVCAKREGDLGEALAAFVEWVEESVENGSLMFDKIAGPKFIERLDYNALLLARMAERDNEIAGLLEQAAAEDAYEEAARMQRAAGQAVWEAAQKAEREERQS
jgi:hypothetical protein